MGTKPILVKAGDTSVMVNGRPLTVDFRIVSEENYKELLRVEKQRDELLEALQCVLDNEKDYQNCTILSVWTRSLIQNRINNTK